MAEHDLASLWAAPLRCSNFGNARVDATMATMVAEKTVCQTTSPP